MDFTCPVCRYAGLYEAPYDDRGVGSYEICPCCGFEFGLDEGTDREAAFAAWRAQWLRDGCPWFSSARTAPEGWAPPAQAGEADLDLYAEEE